MHHGLDSVEARGRGEGGGGGRGRGEKGRRGGLEGGEDEGTN